MTKVSKINNISNKSAKKLRISRKKVGLYIDIWCNRDCKCVFKY